MKRYGAQPRSVAVRRLALRLFKVLGYALIILATMEVALQVLYRFRYPVWYFLQDLNTYKILFEHDPILVGRGRPFAKVTTEHGIAYSHNSMGFRSQETPPQKQSGMQRAIVLGGSSAYCVGVSDSATWPFHLAQLLGKDYQVINMSVPGYSTVEHVIQTALQVSDLSPDICLYYIGWNDVREMHVADLRPDYSNFHALSQYNNLKIFSLKFLNRSLVATFFVRLVNKFFLDANFGFYDIHGTAHELTAERDPRALALFERNIRLIIALCRAQNIKPVMIPQILNYQILVGDNPTPWVPLVREKDLKVALGYYVDALRRICAEENVLFVDGVLQEEFDQTCFLDEGHFNAKGNQKFAQIVARHLKNEKPGL